MENHAEEQSITNDFLSQSYTASIEKIAGAKKDFVFDFQVPKELLHEREKSWDRLFDKYSEEVTDDIELNMETLEPAEEEEDDKEEEKEEEGKEDYYPGARVPMRKSPTRIQYWINTGNPPYKADAEDKEDSEYGSSLSEKELSDSPCTIRRLPLNGCGGKQKQDTNSSCSSVDTVVYILSNANVTKKAETMAIVEGAKSDRNPSDSIIYKNLKSISLRKGRSLDSCKESILHDGKDSNRKCNINKSFLGEKKSKNILNKETDAGINEVGKTPKKSPKNSCSNNNTVFNERPHSNQQPESDNELFSFEKTDATLGTGVKSLSRKKLYSGRDSPVDLMPIRRYSAFKIDQSQQNIHPALDTASFMGDTYLVKRSKVHAKSKRKRSSVQSKSNVGISVNAENNNNINHAESNDDGDDDNNSQILSTSESDRPQPGSNDILKQCKELKEHDNVILAIECNRVNHSVEGEMNEHLSPQFESVQNKDSSDRNIVDAQEEVDARSKVIAVDATKSAGSSDLNSTINVEHLPIGSPKEQKNDEVATNIGEPLLQPAESQSKRDISSPRVSDKDFRPCSSSSESQNLIYVFETQDLDMESDQSTILICECKNGESDECSSVSDCSSLTDDIFEELLNSSLQEKKLSVNSFPSAKSPVVDLNIKLNPVVVLERLKMLKAKRFETNRSSSVSAEKNEDTDKLKYRDSMELIEKYTPNTANVKTEKKEASSRTETDVGVVVGDSNTESPKRNKFHVDRRRTRSTTICEGNLYESSINTNPEVNKKSRKRRIKLLDLTELQDEKRPRTRMSNRINTNYNGDINEVKSSEKTPVKTQRRRKRMNKAIEENNINTPVVDSSRRKSSPLKRYVRKQTTSRRSRNKTTSNPASAERKRSNMQEIKHKAHIEKNVDTKPNKVVQTPNSERTEKSGLLKELECLVMSNEKFFTDLDKSEKRLRCAKKKLYFQTDFSDSDSATSPPFPGVPNKLCEVQIEKLSPHSYTKKKTPQSAKKDLYFQTNFSDSDSATSPPFLGIPTKLLEVRLEKLQIDTLNNDKKCPNKQETPKLRHSKRISSSSYKKSSNNEQCINELSPSNKTVSNKPRNSFRSLRRRLNFSDTSDDEERLLSMQEQKTFSKNPSKRDMIETEKLPEEKVIRTVMNSNSSLNENKSEPSDERNLRSGKVRTRKSLKSSRHPTNVIATVRSRKVSNNTKVLTKNSVSPTKRRKSNVSGGTSSKRNINISSKIKDVKEKVKAPDVMNFKKNMIHKYNNVKQSPRNRDTRNTAGKPLIFQTKFSFSTDSDSESI